MVRCCNVGSPRATSGRDARHRIEVVVGADLGEAHSTEEAA
jgi:hypothetical protein